MDLPNSSLAEQHTKAFSAKCKERAIQSSDTATYNDDVVLMTEALQLVDRAGFGRSRSKTLNRYLCKAVGRRAIKATAYLLENGADATKVDNVDILWGQDGGDVSRQSIAMLDLLALHGWDVNSRFPGGTPFLWSVTTRNDQEYIKWAVDHGAEVKIPGEEETLKPIPKGEGCSIDRPPLLLELAAAHSDVATFEMFRRGGASLDKSQGLTRRHSKRAFHGAVLSAACELSLPGEPLSTKYHQHKAMIKHLLQLGFDINGISVWPWMPLAGCLTPLCWIPSVQDIESKDCKDLVCFLLDHGAYLETTDPDRADYRTPLECAKIHGALSFLKVVEDWKMDHTTG